MAAPHLQPFAESRQHRANAALIRRMVREEALIDRMVRSEEAMIDERLKERYGDLNQVTLFEGERSRQVETNSEARERLIVEVDTRLEDEQQARATKQYSAVQLDLQLPLWFKTVMEAVALIRAGGHTSKTKWRSHTSKLLKRCILESEDDIYGTESRIRLRRIVLEINNVAANELVRLLEDLKKKYVDDGVNAGSKLGADSVMFHESSARLSEIHMQAVPLSQSGWSEELRLLKSKAKLDPTAMLSTVSRPLTLTSSVVTDLFDGSGILLHSASTGKQATRLGLPTLAKKGANYGNVHPFCHNEKQAQALMRMRAAASAGNYQLCRSVFKHNFDPPTKAVPTVGREPPSLDVFRCLMVAFKNASETRFEDAYEVMELIDSYGLVPDAPVYNVMMRACEKESRWRRALAIYRDMIEIHKIIPNVHTFDIIIDCCRHSLESPSVIFESLRLHKLPRDFCHKAALCNCGNRIPSQLLHETLHELASAQLPKHASRSQTSWSESWEEGLSPTNSLQAHKSSDYQWKRLSQTLKSWLPPTSPVRTAVPADPLHAWNTQLSREVPYEQTELDERRAAASVLYAGGSVGSGSEGSLRAASHAKTTLLEMGESSWVSDESLDCSVDFTTGMPQLQSDMSKYRQLTSQPPQKQLVKLKRSSTKL